MILIENFLKSEIIEQKDYDNIVDFINSYNIRKGEYKSKNYILKKLDRRNFILYYEREWIGSYRDLHDEWESHPKEISNVVLIYRYDLLDIINKFAQNNYLNVRRMTFWWKNGDSSIGGIQELMTLSMDNHVYRHYRVSKGCYRNPFYKE